MSQRVENENTCSRKISLLFEARAWVSISSKATESSLTANYKSATILGWWGTIGAAIGLFVFLIGFGVAIVDFPLLANITQNADTHPTLSVNNPPSQFGKFNELRLKAI